jgi:hypothetical protein
MQIFADNSPASLPVKLATRRETKMESDQAIRDHVRAVLSAKQPGSQLGERRKEKREAYPYPVYLTPVDKDGNILLADTVVVLGKHISELGFDFYHREPLPYKRVIVSFEKSPHRFSSLLLDLTWCRFGRHGWYDNGGRFIATVESPLCVETHPSLLA